LKRSNSRVSDTWKQFTVKAIHDGKEVVASGFASWKYDAIGLFLSENPDICFKEIIEIKEEVKNK
jgi:hypothetical protein